MGNYHGVRSFNAFTHEKAVLEKSSALDQSIFFRPLLKARYSAYFLIFFRLWFMFLSEVVPNM